jgi:hypothetical protein
MFKKALILITAVSLSLLAYSDYDMDGVDDAVDKCPNTPFNELVDIRGVHRKKSLEQRAPQHNLRYQLL